MSDVMMQEGPSGHGTGNAGGLHPFYWAVVLLSVGYFLYAAIGNFAHGNIRVGFEELGVTILFLMLSPLAWRAGDAFRRYAAPDWYLGGGSIDLAGKRFFWTYGPQLYGVGGLAVATFIFFAMLEHPGRFQPSTPQTSTPSAPVARSETPPASPASASHETTGSIGEESDDQPSTATAKVEPPPPMSPPPTQAAVLSAVPQQPPHQPLPQAESELAAVAPSREATAVFAPSFDCEKAASVQERLICSNKELAELDVEANRLYARARLVVEDKGALREVQLGWLKHQRGACGDVDCLRDAYESRITELSEQVNDNEDD